MQALILRPAPEAYDIAVFRSMAGTLVHEITEAMRSVCARANM
jgi:sarcosine oxidase gamma subunit